ncbi:MAG: hypothetical protein HYS26_03925 [Candidatus Kaiserbacteria bacterium]|nr:MAG: hypothetical protein HYS26_03925 [Candidatus Kaiserbacteria bacterium]
MTDRPVLKHEEIVFGPITEWELDNALAYVRDPDGKYRAELDRDLLRILANTANERRSHGVILPLLVARVVQDGIPFSNKTEKPKYEAYKGAIMKIFADRYARSDLAKDRQRASAAETRRTGKKKKGEYPKDSRKKHKDQFTF